MIPGHPSPLVTKEEAAAYLGVSARQVKRLIAAADLRSVKLGRRRMVLLSSLDELIERRAA